MKEKYFCSTCGHVEDVELHESWWMGLIVLIFGVPGLLLLEWWVNRK